MTRTPANKSRLVEQPTPNLTSLPVNSLPSLPGEEEGKEENKTWQEGGGAKKRPHPSNPRMGT